MADFDPDAYLDSLEPIGWRLGLERMHRLTTALGMPQHRFASIHVVGTNGKSSVARMTAALLEAHGVGSGTCLSPHTAHWAERTLIHGEQIGAGEWAGAVERVAKAAESVDRTLEEGDAVTQFEAATAATFVALASARVEAAAIEAGLGGRLDATNTIPSRVTVLTSIGLDHTDWLGETELEIAAEKLAVLRDQTTLVLGQVSPAVAALAERVAGVARAGATVQVPGRLERIAEQPPTFVDAAHNPDGAAALAEALPAVTGGRRVVACLAILADKDAAAMVRALAPALDRAVCTELPPEALEAHGRPGAASRPAAELAAACEEAGLPAEAEPSFGTALRRASAFASEPPQGAVLVAGSHYGIAPARAAL